MAHAENKVDWCIRKAEKELKETGRHRGLVRMSPDRKLAFAHVKKADHTLKAVSDFRRMGYSDWSASAAFYAAYHCLLAIAAKHGYESRNQECTFALIRHLAEAKGIALEKELLDRICALDSEGAHEKPTIMEIREMQQYGVETSMEDKTLESMLETIRKIIDQTKEEIER